MILLGVYWSYYLPESIFHINFFKFEEALSGFDDRPASLTATVYTFNPKKVIKRIKEIHDKYNDCEICIFRQGNNLKISMVNYALYDYDFFVLNKIESYLNKNWLVFQRSEIKHSKNENLIRLKKVNENLENEYNPNKNIKIYYSTRNKYSSVSKFIHINCYIATKIKSAYIEDIKEIAISENLNVLYYSEFIKSDISNLHISVSNGRQGINGIKKNYTNIRRFEDKLNTLFEKYNVTFDFQEGFDYDSKGITIEMMVDEDFVIERNNE
ncbi:hypothetical protein [Flavobacterium caseinilyticum]|uniref:Uncharacterized protein n=1 Tax=Flavobacterium caseinilyticum TaxID=2541732 RepID=A0A4R5AWV8_9FLAO|nr:hypothetical protein [Flavobacterium caseinilyticum]TDD75142.1 hypothetical protein E0F89_12205 [Flavobacterium caseinilyticum]